MRFHYIAKAVIRNNGKILILKRSDKNPRSPGKWCLPGGHMEKGEDYVECCKREVLEETGIKINVKQVLHTKYVNGREGDLQLIHVIFEAEILGSDKVTISEEHTAYQWVNENEFQYK